MAAQPRPRSPALQHSGPRAHTSDGPDTIAAASRSEMRTVAVEITWMVSQSCRRIAPSPSKVAKRHPSTPPARHRSTPRSRRCPSASPRNAAACDVRCQPPRLTHSHPLHAQSFAHSKIIENENFIFLSANFIQKHRFQSKNQNQNSIDTDLFGILRKIRHK